MTQVCFRTETRHDVERALIMLFHMGLNEEGIEFSTIEDKLSETMVWVMGKFIVQLPEEHTVQSFKNAMSRTMKEHSDIFYDLHRCIDTLQEGTEPNEDWYK